MYKTRMRFTRLAENKLNMANLNEASCLELNTTFLRDKASYSQVIAEPDPSSDTNSAVSYIYENANANIVSNEDGKTIATEGTTSTIDVSH